jgi:leader peptidase (prepilin peptidase)/N-methyltransferase
MDIAIGVITFIFGTVIGSFLNVCILRLPVSRSIVSGSSACASCGAQLTPIDLVPILSYVVLRGKCRRCKARISPMYPAIEALTGAMYLLLYLRFGLTWQLPVYMALVSLLIVISVIDYKTMEIPNGLVITGLVVGAIQLSVTVFTGIFGNWSSYVIGLFAGGLPLLLIGLIASLLLKREAMGGGDVKLMAFCGLIVGWKLVIPAYLIGIISGAVISVILMAIGRKKRGDEIPFGPLLSLGVVLSVFFGDALIDWYIGLIL